MNYSTLSIESKSQLSSALLLYKKKRTSIGVLIGCIIIINLLPLCRFLVFKATFSKLLVTLHLLPHLLLIHTYNILNILILYAAVVGCSKLKDTEWISRQDPYVCLEYASTKFRTRTCTGQFTYIHICICRSASLTFFN